MLLMNIQFFASKKAAGSTKNGRDSQAKRLTVKMKDDETELHTMSFPIVSYPEWPFISTSYKASFLLTEQIIIIYTSIKLQFL